MAVNENKWGILYCPKNSFRPQKRWENIEKVLRSERIDFDYVQSESTGSVERLVKMMINNGYRTLIIIGGDSALNDAVNCLMQTEKEVRDQIALGVIPNGMMNDFAHFWGFQEGEIERSVKWLKEHRVRKIDLGRINYKNKHGEPCHRYFLNCINIGLIATIMNLRRQTRHIVGSRTVSYVISFILMIFQRLEYKMHLKINGESINRKVMTVCVGNALGYGQTPNAVPYNGLLDVSVVYHPEMAQLIEGIYLFVRGKFLNHKSVHPYRTKEVQVRNEEKALVGIDGRLLNSPLGEYTIRVEQEVINFLIPA
ncbi:diacylglycerol kinase family protein [Prevotella sp. KH2C16]|uniref:diacylglycerol/lipid kinase family protein n=1 Tax=Prevotella sp. KH2C16 TaxID=1855325 RepID=UPI0008EBB0C0|nr:YegS/Rv2252/BmrU family lipid kinase [Prevotella sp. KH2C16]SFF93172.1 lipid kinase, YegS/Rv2252/BmrU family [Prevotella sp. KH2C16]